MALRGVYFSTLSASAHAQSCDDAYLERHMEQLLYFTDRSELDFADSSAHLQAVCVPAQSASAWLDRYAQNCLSAEQRVDFSATVEGPQKLVLGLCSKADPLRDRYLRNLKCLVNMSATFRYCKDKFGRNQRDIGVVEYEDRAQQRCCFSSFQGYRRCLQTLSSAHSSCSTTGDPIGDVIDDIVVRRGGSAPGACPEYVERYMGSGSWRSALELNILLPIVAVLILLWNR